MENRSNIYQLAHPHQTYQKKRAQTRPQFTQFPFIIAEEEGSSPFVEHPQPENIFRAHLESPSFRAQIPVLGYHSVGTKELKSYLQKMEKRRKYMNSMVKRSTESNLSISRTSQMRVPQERYLTKEQVLSNCKISTLNTSQVEEPYLSMTQAHNCTISTNKSHLNLPGEDFSMKKVTKRMKKYQRQWQKQSAYRVTSVPHSQRNKNHHQSASILLNTDKYRQKVQKSLNNQLENPNEVNLQPKLWNKMLRNYASSNEIRQKDKLQRLVKGGLQSRGKGKWRKQAAWLDEKDRQGHFFKLHSQVIR